MPIAAVMPTNRCIAYCPRWTCATSARGGRIPHDHRTRTESWRPSARRNAGLAGDTRAERYGCTLL